MTGRGSPPSSSELDALADYLLKQARHCVRPAVARFRHSWIAPMPASAGTEAYLRSLEGEPGTPAPRSLSIAGTGDGFKAGDYSFGLFHHDASEAAIELLEHEEFREAVAGSLLCLLENASPNGCIYRSELPHKARDPEPAKPVMAQFALRVTRAMGPEWADRHRALEPVARFTEYLERHYTGMHGLFLTHSSLASGFDTDLLSAGLPDKSVEGPDTNAFMVLEYEALAELSDRLGKAADSSRWREKADALRSRIEQLLWHEDERGGFYRALQWQHGVASPEAEVVGTRSADGALRPLESWTTLLPLYAGVPSPERAKRMVQRLTNPDAYWGPWGVRTAPKDSPFFSQAARAMLFDFKKNGRGPVSNWTGPVWVLSNYYLATGLARYGFNDFANELALKTARLLSNGLACEHALRECYDDDGRGLWPQESTFISWNVLALTLARTHPGWPSRP